MTEKPAEVDVFQEAFEDFFAKKKTVEDPVPGGASAEQNEAALGEV
jgi:hypothetical protein